MSFVSNLLQLFLKYILYNTMTPVVHAIYIIYLHIYNLLLVLKWPTIEVLQLCQDFLFYFYKYIPF